VATSGVSTGTLTASDVIKAAMQELGVLSAGENPDGDEMELGLRALNFMLKSWAARGVTSWRNADGEVPVVAGDDTVPLTGAIDVLDVRFVQPGGYERQLQRWELGQYRQLPSKATRGSPVAYAVNKAPTGVTLLLWPVSATTSTLRYSYTRVIEDVTDGAETLDIPQEWLEAVYVALAARLAQAFGVTRIDPATAQILIQRAVTLENDMFAADQPASFYMGAAGNRYF